jgi:hypothetical protein
LINDIITIISYELCHDPNIVEWVLVGLANKMKGEGEKGESPNG